MPVKWRQIRRAVLVLACLAEAPAAAARDYPALLTGEVFSRSAQEIFAPHTPNWRVSITRLAPEGQAVRSGDVVVMFDGTETQRQLDKQREERRAADALTERDLARLEKEVTEAKFAVDQAKVARELTELKAGVMEGLIGALEFAEYQLANERAGRTLENARQQFAEKQQSLLARQRQAELDRQKAELNEEWWQEQLGRLTVKATQPGHVIHANHPWTGIKYQEGDTVNTSFKVAEVADTAELAIRVWVNGVDRPRIDESASLTISFDALPDRTLTGRLDSISDSATKRREWGNAAYFEGTVTFRREDVGNMLLPGMSARVEVGR